MGNEVLVTMSIIVPQSEADMAWVQAIEKLKKLTQKFAGAKMTLKTEIDDPTMLNPEVKAAIERLAEPKKRDREIKVAIEKRRSLAPSKKKGPRGPKVSVA
jgi:hypothetical protein